MVTFTMLAESKCEDPLSEQVIPAPGSSTHTAIVEERPRRAAWISRASAAATVGCDFEVQTTATAAKARGGWIGAGSSRTGRGRGRSQCRNERSQQRDHRRNQQPVP
jgi:hypothetical protein